MTTDQWQWYGSAAHFICGKWCRWHMATCVGDYLVSSVGEYVHPRHGNGKGKTEAEWLADNWPGEDIGSGRKYETMVFRVTGTCECGCGLPKHNGHELACVGSNDAQTARQNHMDMCERAEGGFSDDAAIP